MTPRPTPDDSASDEPRSRRIFRTTWRLLVLLVFCGYAFASPALKFWMGDDAPKYTKMWRYFRSKGVGICDAKYWLEEPDGTREPVDRFAVYGYDDPEKIPPRWLRRLMNGKKSRGRSIKQVTWGMCKRMPVEDAERLFVEARCADKNGWYDLYYGKKPICPSVDKTFKRRAKNYWKKKKKKQQKQAKKRAKENSLKSSPSATERRIDG